MLASGSPAPFSCDPSKPSLLAFFKVSCPVCQFTFPFLERLNGTSLRVIGISQDDVESTREFSSELGISFEIRLDGRPYPLSSAFQITSVPSLFLVEPQGTIAMASQGFSKADLEQIGRRIGVEVFQQNEQIPRFKPG